jgi:hypothetical protein
MARGAVKIKAKPLGVNHVLRSFISARDGLKADTLEAERELGRKSEVIFGSHAPHRTGRLIRGISSIFLGDKVIVRDEAKNPASGYDYVGVTRFGHKVSRLYPAQRFAAFVLATKGRRKTSRTSHPPALRFVIGGKVLYRASVAAYHPDHDWAEEALPEVGAAAQGVATRLGRRIEARF